MQDSCCNWLKLSFAPIGNKPAFAQLVSRGCFWLLSCTLGCQLFAEEPELPAAIKTLQTYCYDCHAGEKPEGGIRVDLFGSAGQAANLAENVEVVEKIILALKDQQMPPADSEQPNQTERVEALRWIEQQLHDFDCGSVSRPGRVTIRRLNRIEYDNTVRDLTGLELNLAKDFPSDDVGNGFDNIGDVLTLPPILMEKYLQAAVEIAAAVAKDPVTLKRVFPHEPRDASNIEEVVQAARDNAAHFALRAFRRPVTSDESERLFLLMRSAWDSGVSPSEIMQTVIVAILASPHFIYRVEDDGAAEFEDGIRALNDFELASRLSYFLWSSMPDERLYELAQAGKLHTPEQLAGEAQRMLADPKAQALVKNFAGQWLQLRDLDRLSPDPALFGVMDDKIRASMRRETELLFSHIMTENHSLLELLNADYSFINNQLAKHYGIEDEQFGDEFRKVDLKGRRRGVLMHASVLLLTSNPTRTSPVKRGKWVLENLLGEAPPPPPPNVPELNESGETLGTLRQQMEQHRANPNCAVCHIKMDAVGFGLENFDAVGRWRVTDGREPIDPTGDLPGNKTFQGPVELVGILAEDKKNEFARTATTKMLTYALGRGLTVSDRCTISQIVDELAKNEYKFGTLVMAIVTSRTFLFQESGG